MSKKKVSTQTDVVSAFDEIFLLTVHARILKSLSQLLLPTVVYRLLSDARTTVFFTKPPFPIFKMATGARNSQFSVTFRESPADIVRRFPARRRQLPQCLCPLCYYPAADRRGSPQIASRRVINESAPLRRIFIENRA